MGMRVFWIILLVAACIGGFFIYDHFRLEKAQDSGAVVCNGCMTPDEKARFDKENSGDTADGQSEHKTRTARAEDAAGNPEGAVAAGQTQPPATTPLPIQIATTPAPAPAPTAASVTPLAPTPTEPTASAGTFSLGSGSSPAAPPMADTVAVNPANNMRFVGTGAYQWYRQGNLTWRVNTASGGSCIAFATLEEWHKQIVYSHGCGRGA
jgi:hypothetical protein